MASVSLDFPLEAKDCGGRDLSVGDRVCIRSVESCAGCLPEEDQERLFALVGQMRTILEFDRFGFVWLSLSSPEEGADFCLFPGDVSRA